LKNDLTKALELLKRGLEIKKNHMLCRFNLGVVLFKLGLVVEATKDFEYLLTPELLETIASHDIASIAYNLAICYV
jgi:tetratricopeptide (TPR) repeat protein